VKSREEIMEILEAFDLTGSFRDAGDWPVVLIAPSPPMSPGATPGGFRARARSGGSG